MIVQSVPLHPDTLPTEIEIDGITYRPPLVDSSGRLTTVAQIVGANGVRALYDAAGRVYTNAYVAGASEIVSTVAATVSSSATRLTVATPAAGKRIRMIAFALRSADAISSLFSLFFGLGSTILITPSKSIFTVQLDTDHTPNAALAWPDGAGPVGAVNDVVSLTASPNISGNGLVVVTYREE